MTQPAPSLPAAAPLRYAVRVRTAGQTYTSPGVYNEEEAAAAADKLQRWIEDVGDGPAFLTFGSRDGRNVRVRARLIVAIEPGVASDPVRRPPAPVGDVHVHLTVEGPLPTPVTPAPPARPSPAILAGLGRRPQ
jgi:hypothetical protein